MQHGDFVAGYKAGFIRAQVDRSQAMHVCDKSSRLPKRYKVAHHFWKWLAFLLVPGGLLSIFWVPWWAGLGAALIGIVMMPAVQKSASQFVLEYSLEDEDFYDQMLTSGVLRVQKVQDT